MTLQPDGRGQRHAIVVARFNAVVTDLLLEGARDALEERGVAADAIQVFRVPGAWELPGTAARLIERGGFDAIIALGCVIRGETPHFDFVAGEAAAGLGRLATGSDVPIVFGVLTTETLEQAMVRAGARSEDPSEHKGREAAITAIEMATLYGTIQ